MKKLIISIGIILMSINLQAQDCYTVREVTNKTENQDLSSRRFVFGIKQMTEEHVFILIFMLMAKYVCLFWEPILDQNGHPL